MKRRRFLAIIAFAGCGALLLSSRADGGRVRHGRAAVPIQVRIEGYVGTKPEGVTTEADWTVSCEGKKFPFHVSHIQVLNGSVSPSSIEESAKPYRLNYYLRGDRQLLRHFAETPPGQKITMSASLRLGSRDLLISAIE